MSSDDFSRLEDLDMGATVRGLRAGQKLLNRYTLKRILGRGGMGVVWLAFDESLEREIAFKFLPETVSHDRTAVDELKRETRQSLELTHPHIVRIYDFVHDEHCAGLSMEYIDGDTLSNLRSDQPNKIFEVADLELWIHQLCSALESAHEDAELAHRDLKPANLMIDKRGRLKVADFGISRSVSNTVARMTMHSGASGTLVYMSPQQAMGEPASILDDIYSMGSTLYELLTSRPPFYQGEILAQVREKVPPSMTQRRKDLGISGKTIPRRWEETVAACLAKDPARRPQSVRDIMQLLGYSDTKRLPRPRIKASEAKKPRVVRAKTGQPRTKGTSEQSKPPATPAPTPLSAPKHPSSRVEPPLFQSEPEKSAAKTAPPFSPAAAVPATAAAPLPLVPSPAPPTRQTVAASVLEPERTTPEPAPEPLTSEPVPLLVERPQQLSRLVILLLLLFGAGWCYFIQITRLPDQSAPPKPVPQTKEDLDANKKLKDAKIALEVANSESVQTGIKLQESEQQRQKLKTQLDALEKKQKEDAERRIENAKQKEIENNKLQADADKKGKEAKANATAANLKALLDAEAKFAEKKKADAKKEEQAEADKRNTDKTIEDMTLKLKQTDTNLEKEKQKTADEKQKNAALAAKVKEYEDKAKEEKRLKDARGSVEVKTIPKGAEVTIFPRPKEVVSVLTNDVVLFTNLPIGQYTVEIQLADYEPIKIETVVEDTPAKTLLASARNYPVRTALRRTKEWEAEQERKRKENLRGSLEVRTIPKGAQVTILPMPREVERVLTNDAVLFTGLKVNSYTVEVQLDGYEPATITAEVTDTPAKTKYASTSNLTVTLVRSTGTLTLKSKPDKVSYTLTGPENRSGQTPDTFKLTTGKYKVELKKGQWVMNEDFTISRSEIKDLPLELPYGSFILNSEPSGAAVYSKGKKIGETPLGPLDFNLGAAEFSLKKKGLRDADVNLLIKQQQTTNLIVPLARSRGPDYGQKWTNSLGMIFVPINKEGKILMCIWETRKRDYQKIYQTYSGPSDFKQTDGHPVVSVNWQQAMDFCVRLTKQERELGEKEAPFGIEKQSYRLPKDVEWSEAAGLQAEKGDTPKARHIQQKNKYPWGTVWPPPAWAGNYDVELSCDPWPNTSIVGQFKKNSNGLFDIGGNVWEWCEDWFDAGQKTRVARGGSWRSLNRDRSVVVLLTSYRLDLAATESQTDVGFRCVLDIGELE